jgi:hypothetical protein
VSTVERAAVQRVIEMATGLGVDVPAEVHGLLVHLDGCGSYPARVWAEQHPDDEPGDCCWGAVVNGPAACTCWTPVFDIDQAEPRPPAAACDLKVQKGMCHDCAYRPGSAERAEAYLAEHLMEMPARGQMFWCHQGMRRPVEWVHPDGRIVPGSPDDWQPAALNGVPYQADGQPGLICAGWAAIAAKAGKR